MRFDRRSLLVALMVAGAPFGALAQSAPPRRIRGRIAGLDGEVLAVDARDGGRLEIRLAEPLTVNALRRLDLSAVTRGTFIGTAAVPGGDGRLKALEVLVFPEAMRGTGEGHYPWDLVPSATMTNATVEAVVDQAVGRTLELALKDRKVTVDVPPEAPIVTFAPATRADLVPGAAVFLVAAPDKDGRLAASRVTVEKNGVAPPM
jgi:hypothetical protein